MSAKTIGRSVVYQRRGTEFIHLSKPFRTKEQAEKERVKLKSSPRVPKVCNRSRLCWSEGLTRVYSKRNYKVLMPQHETLGERIIRGITSKGPQPPVISHWRTDTRWCEPAMLGWTLQLRRASLVRLSL